MAKRKAKTKKRKGTFHKAVYFEYENNPLPSRSKSGRFHDEKTGMDTTYLTPIKETAWKEVTFRWRADPASYRIAEVEVSLQTVLDLTDPEVQKEYGVNRNFLISDDYRQTQRLARDLRINKVQAVWTYSRVDSPDGRVLVVFMENLEAGSFVRVKTLDRIKL